jgi:ABC-type branched-subunit amino acid transport system substrate-binding protein
MPKQSPSVRPEQEGRDEALEAYLLEHVPGLRDYEAAQHRAFIQIEQDAYERHPDPTPNDIAAAGAAEAALPFRKRTVVQLRRSFAPLAAHLPSEVKRSRKRFVQRHQRAWNRANPTPLTWEHERTFTAAFMKTYALRVL